MENNRSILSTILNPNDLDLELLGIYKKNYLNIEFLKTVDYNDGITEITIKSNDGDSIITIGHGKLSCNSETAIFTSDSFTNVNIESKGSTLNFNIGECITVSCEGKKTIIPNSFNISTHFTDANLYFTLAVINYGTKVFFEKVNELITKTNIETSNDLNIDGLVEDLPPELPEELRR